MTQRPPDSLVDLLAGLGLADRRQVEGVAGRVRRLAGELPLFESVWVDALCQARVLTPFQAAEINAGRGEGLRVGPYLLSRGLPSNGLGQWFIARHAQSGPAVRILRCRCDDQDPAEIIGQVRSLIEDLQGLAHPGLAAPREAGLQADEVWVACEQIDGVCAADWLAHNGRLPGEAVLEIARQLAAGLAALEHHGRWHTDLGSRQLILTPAGIATLVMPGIRGILRPAEGYTRLDLLPEGYDYLAPERIAAGTPPDAASEMYAFGCLLWHLLCGRPPLSGGDCLSKVRSAQQGRTHDVQRYAADAPATLVEAIAACTRLDPRQRPATLAELSRQLGLPESRGRAAVARCLRLPRTLEIVRRKRTRPTDASSAGTGFIPVATATLILFGLGAWWFGRRSEPLPLTQIRGPTTATATLPAAPSAPARQGPMDLVLEGGRVSLAELRIAPGQTVRSAAGKRTRVVCPPSGVLIEGEDVCFENLDFVPSESMSSGEFASLVQIRALRATFRGCSFQAHAASLPIAIEWRGPQGRSKAELLPTGHLRLTDCVFHRVSEGIRVSLLGAVRLELTNSLHLGRGSWIALPRLPAADEPCLLSLTHCTLRGGRALIEVHSDSSDRVSGEIQVRTDDCLFEPARDGALLHTNADQSLRCLRVTGQGSILSLGSPVAVCQDDQGVPRPVADERIDVAGLVRSQITFAGDNLRLPQTSRVIRWQAPLVSQDAPGILEGPLHLPDM